MSRLKERDLDCYYAPSILPVNSESWTLDFSGMSCYVAFSSLHTAYSHSSYQHDEHFLPGHLTHVRSFRLVSLTTHLVEFLVPRTLKPQDLAKTTKLGQQIRDNFSTLKFFESEFSAVS